MAATRAGLSQAEIAARLGITNAKSGRVNNWFSARNFPRSSERPALARLLGVRSEWLFHGEGEPQQYSDNPEVNEAVARFGIKMREVPVISWSHAGEAAVYEEMPKHFAGTVHTASTDPKAFGLTVEGDSMEPRVYPGDRVVCEPSREPANGKPVVVRFRNDSVQLRFFHRMPNGKIRLAPANPIYPAIEHDPEEFFWIYPVKELVRSF